MKAPKAPISAISSEKLSIEKTSIEKISIEKSRLSIDDLGLIADRIRAVVRELDTDRFEPAATFEDHEEADAYRALLDSLRFQVEKLAPADEPAAEVAR